MAKQKSKPINKSDTMIDTAAPGKGFMLKQGPEYITIERGQGASVVVLDEPGFAGACHKYRIDQSPVEEDELNIGRFGCVNFQQGLPSQKGVNGCAQEDLLAIVIHRLKGFQSGKFPCRENAIALTKIEEALHWLQARTTDRMSRGVEGKNEA